MAALVLRVEAFESNVAATQTKFRRLISDTDVFVNRIERENKKVNDMVRVMRSEQLAQAKMVSSLVEMEFVQ